MSVVESFEQLIGQTIVGVSGAEAGSESIDFELADGAKYRLYHDQDCCESVRVQDIAGDVADVVGSPVVLAEESSSHEKQDGKPDDPESFTWTFYRLGTVKGTIVIRWLGESNGYYSESVSWDKA